MTTTDAGQAVITYVIPCSAAKLDHAAPARDLYTGTMFRHTLANVERMAAVDNAEGLGPARVLILSARYGLIDLDTVIEPYEQRMDQPGSITADDLADQALTLGIDWGAQVYGVLPRVYLARLDSALRQLDVYVQDVYEGCSGIGEQRRVNSIVGRPAVAADEPDQEAGPIVWVGGDVAAFAWGIPLLVSYGRLRSARVLPVALAPWVIDSRAYSEIAEHGRWTIDPTRYVTDLRRYRDEIGRLTWVAPQDWPAGPALLARTGLTEDDHQQRTVASVRELRTLAPDLPIICVVTGTTPAGYLRHVAQYRTAGIDLREERLVVGVGALVGRTVRDTAAILTGLHLAGLTRLHGFGVKGPVLNVIGGMVESIDSAAWSAAARREVGPCPHGLVAWEANCPVAAKEWAARQRARSAAAPAALDLLA